jgi:hypothetical protein
LWSAAIDFRVVRNLLPKRQVMSTKIPPETVTPADPDGADALRRQPQSGTPDINATAPLTGAKEPH